MHATRYARRSLSEGDRSESVRITLAAPFSGFEKQMREAMGIVVKKRGGSSATTISEVTNADTSVGKEKVSNCEARSDELRLRYLRESPY